MNAWPARSDHPDDERAHRVALASHRLQRSQEIDEVWRLIFEELDWWLEPTALRAYRLDEDGAPIPVRERDSDRISTDAALMEAALMIRALTVNRSLVSCHPRIEPELEPLSVTLGAAGSVVLVLLVRADRRTHALVSIHWAGLHKPDFTAPQGFYNLWDNAGFALARCQERARLERAAFFDHMTGLPNQAGLDRELTRHERTHPFGILVADFDGMREANAAFENNYALGGDVLIHAVADELRRFAGGDEFAARLHTRGDEFCLLLPGSDPETTARRAQELEAALEALQVPASHRHVYKGASVGHASRTPEERPGLTLGRASEEMHARKKQRRGDR